MSRHSGRDSLLQNPANGRRGKKRCAQRFFGCEGIRNFQNAGFRTFLVCFCSLLIFCLLVELPCRSVKAPGGNGPASTTLTVTTSATVSRYGSVMPRQIGPWSLLIAIALFSLAMLRAGKLPSIRLSPLAASAAAILTLCLVIGGCGGYSNSSPANKGTATIMVTAQSGAVAHTTTVSVTVQ
jgi:hypothetical protein